MRIDNNNQQPSSNSFDKIFKDSASKEAKMFFAGARAMMEALQAIPSDQHAAMLARKNQQHIMAVLLAGKLKAQEIKRQEALVLAQYCQIDKAKFRSFIFDVPAIDGNGRAVDANGELLEDDNFKPIPGKDNPGWPQCHISRIDSEEEISLEKYNSLSPEEKKKYSRYRTLTVKSSLNTPIFQVRSFDCELVEELIRRDIAIGDPVNKRYSKEAACRKEDGERGELWMYRETIQSALAETFCQHGADSCPLLSSTGYSASTEQK